MNTPLNLRLRSCSIASQIQLDSVRVTAESSSQTPLYYVTHSSFRLHLLTEFELRKVEPVIPLLKSLIRVISSLSQALIQLENDTGSLAFAKRRYPGIMGCVKRS